MSWIHNLVVKSIAEWQDNSFSSNMQLISNLHTPFFIIRIQYSNFVVSEHPRLTSLLLHAYPYFDWFACQQFFYIWADSGKILRKGGWWAYWYTWGEIFFFPLRILSPLTLANHLRVLQFCVRVANINF